MIQIRVAQIRMKYQKCDSQQAENLCCRAGSFREALIKKKKKNCNKCYIGSDPPPPIVTNNTMYFFSETRPLLGHFLKKSVFCPLEMSNTCKNFQNPKIDQKMAKYETPPLFFTWNFFYQNDSEWPKMDFKHNFKKCNILSAGFFLSNENKKSNFVKNEIKHDYD